MRLYLLRHGETDWNKQKRVQGHSDIPLNEYGKFLAKETAKALKKISFHAAYTSPLQRAKETADIVLGERKISLYEDPRIMEIGFGEAEGMCYTEENPTQESEEFHNFFSKPHQYKVPQGGESFQQLEQRVSDFLDELYLKQQYQDKTILISTHGAAVTEMLNLMKRQSSLERFWENGVPKNCAISIVEVTHARAEILVEGKTYY